MGGFGAETSSESAGTLGAHGLWLTVNGPCDRLWVNATPAMSGCNTALLPLWNIRDKQLANFETLRRYFCQVFAIKLMIAILSPVLGY